MDGCFFQLPSNNSPLSLVTKYLGMLSVYCHLHLTSHFYHIGSDRVGLDWGWIGEEDEGDGIVAIRSWIFSHWHKRTKLRSKPTPTIRVYIKVNPEKQVKTMSITFSTAGT